MAIIAFALLGTAVMQRALHGLAVSPLTAAVERHVDARVVATLVDDPDAARFDARALVRVASVNGRGGRATTGARHRVGRRRRSSAAPGRGGDASCSAAGSPSSRDSTRAGGGSTRSARSTPPTCSVLGHAQAPLTRAANDARALVLAGSEHLDPTDRALLAGFLLGDPGRARHAHRAVPRRRTHPPDGGLGRVRRCHACAEPGGSSLVRCVVRCANGYARSAVMGATAHGDPRGVTVPCS